MYNDSELYKEFYERLLKHTHVLTQYTSQQLTVKCLQAYVTWIELYV